MQVLSRLGDLCLMLSCSAEHANAIDLRRWVKIAIHLSNTVRSGREERVQNALVITFFWPTQPNPDDGLFARTGSVRVTAADLVNFLDAFPSDFPALVDKLLTLHRQKVR
jgi:hypothetical protein